MTQKEHLEMDQNHPDDERDILTLPTPVHNTLLNRCGYLFRSLWCCIVAFNNETISRLRNIRVNGLRGNKILKESLFKTVKDLVMLLILRVSLSLLCGVLVRSSWYQMVKGSRFPKCTLVVCPSVEKVHFLSNSFDQDFRFLSPPRICIWLVSGLEFHQIIKSSLSSLGHQSHD